MNVTDVEAINGVIHFISDGVLLWPRYRPDGTLPEEMIRVYGSERHGRVCELEFLRKAIRRTLL